MNRYKSSLVSENSCRDWIRQKNVHICTVDVKSGSFGEGRRKKFPFWNERYFYPRVNNLLKIFKEKKLFLFVKLFYFSCIIYYIIIRLKAVSSLHAPHKVLPSEILCLFEKKIDAIMNFNDQSRPFQIRHIKSMRRSKLSSYKLKTLS